jgi:tetratricopeptide (TPR) repeat protein
MSPAEKDAKKAKGADTEVRDAIIAFEQILEAIPNDRLALETLYDAYLQIGDKAKAIEHLTRLSKVVVDDQDSAAAPPLLEKLVSLAGGDPSAQKMIEGLKALSAKRSAAAAPAAKKPDVARRRIVDITSELALAWNLVQTGELSQEDYSNVVHDLTESSSKNVEVPISVLHVLHDRGFKHLDKVLNSVAGNSGLPIIPLASFDVQKEAYNLLPVDFMMHRGAIVFELMGSGDALVAILNPYDTELRDAVKKTVGRRCHFYLASAENYDACLENIRKALKAAAEAAAKE